MPGPYPTTVFFDLGDTLVTTVGGVRQRYADTLDCLQILQARGYRLGLISNQPAGTSLATIQGQLEQLRLARYIEAGLVTLSTEIPGNVGKPAQPIFDLALAKAGHDATSTRAIFVSETAADVLAARGFGWRGILKRNGSACLPGDGECAGSLAALLEGLPALADLAGSNLDLAPPPRLVDGLWAVPVDISQINAALSFDAATQQASGDATLEFRLGANAGCPIFDLRQTPTGAWLDGTPIPLGEVATHDFGGGAQANLRVLARVLEAGSSHSLRLTYGVGLPQASTAGSYQPQVTWSAGPRLVFNFGFTDLGAGRYLEAFVPANLIYDQFSLTLDLQLLNTPIAHTPITNGTVSALGANHWSIAFPSRSTAFSPLLELRPTDSLQSATANVVLPVSGSNVAVTAWKLTSNPVNIATQANTISGFLVDNENSSGRYLHGERFTAFIHQGGMEYDGGTTSGTGPLRHEAFHSWWARGLKPASQPDAWFDEAWTVYHDNGAAGVQPFNFADPPVPLCPRNPWVRVTHIDAYGAGERVWKGIAALAGAATLGDQMRAFYQARHSRPVRSEDIECHLLARTGHADCVDGFHRFVYGFADPSPLPDLWLRDDTGDPGGNDWPGRFWDSPDLWIRNRDDDGLEHQNPEYGQDNWIHARVRNRSATGTARHLVVSFNIKAFAGSQFVYPADFLPAVTAAAAFELGPGETRILKARLPRSAIPPVGSHPCLLASVFTRFDRPQAGKHVWEQNNLAQKNLTVVDLAPSAWIVLPLLAINLRPRLSRTVELELLRPAGLEGLAASLLLEKRTVPTWLRAGASVLPVARVSRVSGHLDCSCGEHPDTADAASVLLTNHAPERLAEAFPGALELAFAQGQRTTLPVLLRPAESQRIGLRVKVPANAKRGSRFTLDLVQRENGRIVGGVALEVRVS
ncbi:HAD family hydrolase [Pseudomonas sp. LFM046]|uniref:HAD family hydrolase n=1 Tax=Pseudomonas sp. LFM046 TaxID=1608357 RepID=UPI0005CFAA1E|nr:HAD family hydrolase [Pseudomonas sp. LFM046]